jgi:hypothetical protein
VHKIAEGVKPSPACWQCCISQLKEAAAEMGCGGGSDGSSGDKVAVVTMVLVVVVSHMQGHAQNSINRP